MYPPFLLIGSSDQESNNYPEHCGLNRDFAHHFFMLVEQNSELPEHQDFYRNTLIKMKGIIFCQFSLLDVLLKKIAARLSLDDMCLA